MIMHQTHGRIRVRLCSSIDFVSKSAELRETLLSFDGVQRVEGSTSSKTVVVSFDPKRISSGQIMKVVEKKKAVGNLYFLPFASNQVFLARAPGQAARDHAQDEWITDLVAAVSLKLVDALLESLLSSSGKLILRRLNVI